MIGRFWFFGLTLLIVATVVVLYRSTRSVPLMRNIEALTLDFRFQLRGVRLAGVETAIILIDDATLAALGRWPVSRRHFARLVDRLAAAEARVIAFDLLFSEAEPPYARPVMDALTAARPILPADSPEAADIDHLLSQSTPDRLFADALRRAGNVLIPYAFTYGQNGPEAVPPAAPDFILDTAIQVYREPDWGAPLFPVTPTGLLPPLSELGQAAASGAYVNVVFDTDGALRFDYAVLPYDWDYMPSFAIEVMRLYLGVPRDQVLVEFGRGVHIGPLFLPTNRFMGHVVNYHGPAATFPTYSFIDVLEGRVPPTLFRDRIVLIGATPLGIEDVFQSPFTNLLPGVERFATLIDTMLHGDHLIRDDRTTLLDLVMIALCGLAAGLVLYSIPHMWMIPAGAGLLVLWSLGNHLAFAELGLWLNYVYPTLSAILAMTSVFGIRVASAEVQRRRAQRALRASEERYALAARGANDGLWDWDLDQQCVYYSPRWLAMVGEADGRSHDAPSYWFDRVHPFDLPLLHAAIDAHLVGSSAHLEAEYRIRHTDGAERWMLARGLAVRDQTGRPVRMAGSQTDVTERRRTEEKLLRDAVQDGLTGLANRALFLDRVNQAIARHAMEPDWRFAIFRINLDGFRQISDTLGQAVADRLLIAVARRLEQLIDRRTDGLARLGGDDLAALVEGFQVGTDLESLAHRFQEAIAVPIGIDDRTVQITATVGIVRHDHAGGNANDALRNADLTVTRTRRDGPGLAATFDPSFDAEAAKRFDLEVALREAIEAGDQLELFYQPIVTLPARRLAGFEALMRWRHPSRGLISPGDFIPIAEETGLIVPMGNWAIKRACRQIVEWRRLAAQPFTIAVNVSGRQFSDADLARRVHRELARSGAPADHLKLEVTESMMLNNPEQVIEVLRQIVAQDVNLSIDDFGTGYSSLSYLHRLPFHTLKIDRSFVMQMGDTLESLEIVRVVVSLARSLGRDTVAEGVETEEQMCRLVALGVTHGQGYLFAKPLPALEAARFL